MSAPTLPVLALPADTRESIAFAVGVLQAHGADETLGPGPRATFAKHAQRLQATLDESTGMTDI